MRKSIIARKTRETDIQVSLVIEGTGESSISTGCGFMDHMLAMFAKHGRFDLHIACKGDVEVDCHHSIEDVGICLGKAFDEALSDKRGITRFSDVLLPMDEALILCAVDVSGRSWLETDLRIPTQKVGDFDTELVMDFLLAFANHANITTHIRQFSGRNTHHIIEGVFKALGRALAQACKIQKEYENEIPSTKGVL